jgi:hypothetical protein
MSDGPHKSLPMRRGWKRVAECGGNSAFSTEEVSAALIPALEQDCRDEIPSGFVSSLRNKFINHQPSLFKDQKGPQLEHLRDLAGAGIGRIVLEHAIRVAECGGSGIDGLVEAATAALIDRADRGNRQVEEHYCREVGSSRAQKVRTRIGEGIRGAPINGLARKILDVEPGQSFPPTVMQRGLDDGVKLR